MYVEIIFAQDGETFDEVQEIFAEEGYIAVIDYLSQWDFGYESEHMFSLVENIEHHRLENHYAHGEYILIEHPLYFALYRKAYSKE